MHPAATGRWFTWTALTLAALATPTMAQTPTNTWTNAAASGTLNWSDAANWNTAPAAGGSTTTIRQFNATGSASYTANDDLAGTFSLLGVNLNSSSTNP